METKVLSEEELIELLNKQMDKKVIGAEKAAHGGEVVVKYQS